jgi:hypothetical protein
MRRHPFYIRMFKHAAFRNLTIQVGKYGLYIRDTFTTQVHNCQFAQLGSTGSPSIHDHGNTQAQQAAHWAGSNTSNGGAMRLRSSNRILVDGCYIFRCARGGIFDTDLK